MSELQSVGMTEEMNADEMDLHLSKNLGVKKKPSCLEMKTGLWRDFCIHQSPME